MPISASGSSGTCASCAPSTLVTVKRRVARDHQRRELLEEQAQARLALAQLDLPSMPRARRNSASRKRALGGGPEPFEVVLEDVVVGAQADRFDRSLFADRARDDQSMECRYRGAQAARACAGALKRGIE